MTVDGEGVDGQSVARFADSLRRVIGRFVGTTAPPEAFRELADELDALAERLAAFDQRSLFEFPDGHAAPGTAGPAVTMFSPVIGRAHPFAPPVRVTAIGRHVEGQVTFGTAYEGPPGHVHGGFVAATLDELLGMTLAVQHVPGMTGRLTINYRRPTPLHTDLHVVAEVTRVDGRKAYVDGRILDGDTICAEAEGLFVTVDFGQLARDWADRSGPSLGDNL
ncbi:MAG: PaaI family thioesterase [Acidimicrobiales bacterium]